MATPVVIAITIDMVEAVRQHLAARGVDVAYEDLAVALQAAARFEDPIPQPDLFGDS